MGAVCLYRLARALTGRPRLAVISAVLYAGHPISDPPGGTAQRSGAGDNPARLVQPVLRHRGDHGRRRRWPGSGWDWSSSPARRCHPCSRWARPCSSADRRPRAALAFSLATLIVACPLPIRNHLVNGSWWPTRSGLSLYIGNSPYTAALLPDQDLASILQADALALVERERPNLSAAAREDAQAVDALLTRRALAYMTEHPFRTLGQKLRNVLYLFSPRLVPFHVATPGRASRSHPRGRSRWSTASRGPLRR